MTIIKGPFKLGKHMNKEDEVKLKEALSIKEEKNESNS